VTTCHDSHDRINEEILELELSDETLAVAQTDMHGLPTLFHLTIVSAAPVRPLKTDSSIE
jgi:hypothetical protein